MAELKPWLEQQIEKIDLSLGACDNAEDRTYYAGKIRAFVEVLEHIKKQQAISAWNKRSK